MAQGWRDSRFGQWANPDFGASLGTGMQTGVLPTQNMPGASDGTVNGPSASSGLQPGESYTPKPGNNIPKWNGLQPGESNTPAPGFPQSNMGTMFLEDGGVIDEDPMEQDSGNAAPSASDPFSFIAQALQHGRKRAGLPTKFFDTKLPPKPPSSNDPLATAQAVRDEGPQENPDVDVFQKNQFINNLGPDEEAQWGDTTIRGKERTAYLAEGGEVDDETGVIPTENSPQAEEPQGGNSPQAAMAYLSGQGAVGPEIAAALEQQVDPQGQMDPTERKMRAIAAAGDPDKAFQVMQHYRQKFNAYSAFARAALQGAGGRPPNPAAAADALNKAYANVPDGTSLQFSPGPGGFQVAMRKLGGGKAPPTQEFAEGGAVEDENYDDTYQSPSEDQALRDQPAGGAPSGDQALRDEPAEQAAFGRYPSSGRRPGAATMRPETAEDIENFNAQLQDKGRQVVLGIPQMLKWLASDGQFDKAVEEQGVDISLAAAASQGPQGQPQQAAPPEPIGPEREDPHAAFVRKATATPTTREDAQRLGTEIGTEGGQNSNTLADVLHEIDEQFPYVGQNRQRLEARVAARLAWQKNYQAKVDAENMRGNFRLTDTGMRVEGRHQDVNTQQEAGTRRAELKATTATDIADKNRASRESEGAANRQVRTDNAIMMNKPSVLDRPSNMQAARDAVARPQAPPAQQQAPAQPAQQQAQSGSGPAPKTPPPPGMRYEYSASRNMWRLVPVQQ